MSFRKNERCPIRNSFFCCRWKQRRRQREFASPVSFAANHADGEKPVKVSLRLASLDL
jgi:hypothetical protein